MTFPPPPCIDCLPITIHWQKSLEFWTGSLTPMSCPRITATIQFEASPIFFDIIEWPQTFRKRVAFLQPGVILWCSAINYCYTTIINNFLNENDSVDLRCILIIRVKHNYIAALSWHVHSFRAQFCFNTLIM